MRWLLAPYAEPRTFRILVYLILGLPLGILDFVLVVTGLSLGLGLFITLLGIPVLVATLLVAKSLATFERRLAWAMLDAPMPRLSIRREEGRGSLWRRLSVLGTSRRTWSEVAFLLLRLPLGVLGFMIAAGIVGLMVLGLVEPILVAAGLETQIGSWTIDTLGESLVYLPISVLFVLVGPRLIVAWGGVSARIATAMLGLLDPRELKRAVGDVLARRYRADAFQIMDELELRLGQGPFLTPTRLEATLLSLESSGIVIAWRDPPRTIYALG
jgi:Putative sensor